MRIAYFGGDWFSGCLDVWQANGHTISHLFTDGEETYNGQIRQWAEAKGIQHFNSKPSNSDMQQLLNDKVDLLFSVEYPWKIPCSDFPFKTINVHPSLLPHGRGPNPISWSLLKYPQHAGISLHQLADAFDTGDIVYQEAVKLNTTQNFDDYLTLLETKIPELVAHLCQNFDEMYNNAKPQSGGSYWPKLTLNDRKISWQMTTDEITRIIRATGKFGIVTIIEDQIHLVKDVKCQSGNVPYSPGTIFNEDAKYYYIAVSDGQCIVPKSGILESTKLKS